MIVWRKKARRPNFRKYMTIVRHNTRNEPRNQKGLLSLDPLVPWLDDKKFIITNLGCLDLLDHKSAPASLSRPALQVNGLRSMSAWSVSAECSMPGYPMN